MSLVAGKNHETFKTVGKFEKLRAFLRASDSLSLEAWKAIRRFPMKSSRRDVKIKNEGESCVRMLTTCEIVGEDARSNDAAVAVEDRLQVGLGDVLRQSRHIQVCTFDGLRAGPCERDLRKIHFNLPPKAALTKAHTLIVLFCNRRPFRVLMALSASSCRW